MKRERLVPKPPGEILAFEHPQLLKKLERKLGLTSEQAKELFLELMNFLLLCATTTGSHEPTPRVDEAWHEFILYTADYAAFCEVYAGFFIHHRPAIESDAEICNGMGCQCESCEHPVDDDIRAPAPI